MENVQHFLKNQVIEAIEHEYEYGEPDQKNIRIHPEFGIAVAHIDLGGDEFLIIVPGINCIFLSFSDGFRAELAVQITIILEKRFRLDPHVMVLTPEFFDTYIKNPNTAFDQYYEEYDTHMPLW